MTNVKTLDPRSEASEYLGPETDIIFETGTLSESPYCSIPPRYFEPLLRRAKKMRSPMTTPPRTLFALETEDGRRITSFMSSLDEFAEPVELD
ncbi:MAG: hypothetical protein KDD55_04395 [Bdellovibrionales bacterium]|nr:hypothetical protein [Bdellovibrionales bacterium]